MIVLFGMGALAGYRYLTQPARVYGAKLLKCSVFSVTTQPADRAIRVKGCGRQIDVQCGPKGCQPTE
ncbi:MAG: hypothetical protein R3E66_23705 [bacterium]